MSSSHPDPRIRQARFAIGQIVRHRVYPFRGLVYDIDPVFSSSEQWLAAIPEDIRPAREQPFYYLLAEGEQGPYMAYVSEQNLEEDDNPEPVSHPDIGLYLETTADGHFRRRREESH